MPGIRERRSACFSVADSDRNLRISSWLRFGIVYFMAFYTAIEGTLLTNGKRQHALLDMVTRILYLLLFPAMLIVFVCFELGFTEYGIVVPVLTIAGVVILVLGAVSYFVYDPYRLDRKNHKKADRYIRDIEKAAVKEVELEEKALAKQSRKQEKLELKEEARQERAAKRRERKNRRDEKLTGWKESIRKKLPAKKKATEESRTETGIPKEPEAVTEEKPQAGAEESGTPETTGPVENTEPVETVEQKDAPAEPELRGHRKRLVKRKKLIQQMGRRNNGLLSD